MKYLLIFCILFFSVFVTVTINDIDALCMPDPDWPDAPCYGCPYCYPGLEQEQIDMEPYYDYKGAEFMEQKRKEMMTLLEQGKLDWWNDYSAYPSDDSNYNVWRYYYLNGEVPREYGKYVYEFDPPRYQFHERHLTSYVGVLCNDGLKLLIKEGDKTPACVYENSVPKLIDRNWGFPIKTKNIENTDVDISYEIEGGTLMKIIPDGIVTDSKNGITESLIFEILPAPNGTLTVNIPYDVMNTLPDYWRDFEIFADEAEIEPLGQNRRNHFHMYMIPFETDTSKIAISLPPPRLWLGVEQINSSDSLDEIMELSKPELEEYPDLYHRINDADDGEGVLYATPSPTETEKLANLFEFEDYKQQYLKYENNLYNVTLSFQYGHP